MIYQHNTDQITENLKKLLWVDIWDQDQDVFVKEQKEKLPNTMLNLNSIA